MRLEFSRQILEIQTSNFIKIRLVWAELFNADGLKGRHDEGNSPFRDFANVCKMLNVSCV